MSAFEEACRAMEAKRKTVCPHCKDERQQEYIGGGVWLCNNCSKTYAVTKAKA